MLDSSGQLSECGVLEEEKKKRKRAGRSLFSPSPIRRSSSGNPSKVRRRKKLGKSQIAAKRSELSLMRKFVKAVDPCNCGGCSTLNCGRCSSCLKMNKIKIGRTTVLRCLERNCQKIVVVKIKRSSPEEIRLMSKKTDDPPGSVLSEDLALSSDDEDEKPSPMLSSDEDDLEIVEDSNPFPVSSSTGDEVRSGHRCS